MTLRAFAADRKSFEGAEKDDVLARIGNRRIRGLNAEDFRDVDFILCFEKETLALLKVLKTMAGADAHGAMMPAKIHYVDISHDLNKSDQLMAAKKELRLWATNNLGWRRPDDTHDKSVWNTKQVIIPEAGYRALLRSSEKRLESIKKVSGCDLHFSARMPGDTRMVSITGRKDKLHLAATKVRVDPAPNISIGLRTNSGIGDVYLVNGVWSLISQIFCYRNQAKVNLIYL